MTEPPDGATDRPSGSGPDPDALLSGRVASTPELVIALVTGLGTSVGPVVEDFRAALQAVNYRMEFVRVSELIHELSAARPPSATAATHAEQLMDEGDRLREAVAHGGAACALALTKIRQQRSTESGSALTEREGVATLVQSLKHPEEVRLLRTVYGPRLLVVGVSASLEQREHALRDRLRDEHPGHPPEWYVGETTRLLIRDEKDQSRILGQRVRDAFSEADAFVWVQPGSPSTQAIRRIIELVFGKPFETPTKDEQGMFFAYAAQFRSAASGRQVGAALVDPEGELLVTGTNEVPRPAGGQYWAGDHPDHRDYQSGAESNDHHKYMLVQDALHRLSSAGWIAKEQLVDGMDLLTARALDPGGPLHDSRVGDLIEFGRVAHAEMAAISTAGRRGTPLRGATLYTTTFPCHECARLIIAAGIDRVVYIDPYPKSQVFDMYGHQVSTGGSGAAESGKLPFVPFHGVAPRLYPAVFAMGSRRRDSLGRFQPWIPRPRLTSDPRAVDSMIGFETAVASEMLRRLREAGWGPAAASSNVGSSDVGGE